MLRRLAPTEIYRLESRRFVLWLPVFMGVGIAWYFALDVEPSPWWAALGAVPFAIAATGLARRIGWAAVAVNWAAFAVVLGFGSATWSAHRIAAPVVAYPMGETVEGRVIGLSRSASGSPRMLLDRLIIYGVEPERTPDRVRLTILDPVPEVLPMPGQRIRVYATLIPNGEPVEPGAFDFQRRAFFMGLGGVGLTRGYVTLMPAGNAAGLWDRGRVLLAQIRDSLSRGLRTALPGRQGAFAAAIIVGDRADIEEVDAEALRASNLAHLLAISGLHMGILTGLVFAIVRLLLAAIPYTADAFSTKKAAAIAALVAGLAYLALSGGTVATQRAFIMVAVAFTAVLLDRPAITLRALAIAATVILLIRPISLLDAGFQMSFAATVALVAGFDATRGMSRGHRKRRPWHLAIPRTLMMYVGGLLFSSLLAGVATGPIAAYHFNRTAPYGLLSNLLALPVMGFWIAPSACIAAVLAPLGLADPVLRLMGLGIEQILRTAHWVASLPGAVQPVQATESVVLALIAIGGLWLSLWRGPWRLAGPLIVFAGLWIWSHPPPRPDVLLSANARLVGVMSPDGRVLDRDRAQSFAAKTWLRRDGDGAEQAMAAARAGMAREKGRLGADFGDGWRLEVFWGRGIVTEALRPLCREKTLMIVRSADAPDGPCRALGKDELARLGAMAISTDGGKLILRQARDPKRQRLWTQR
ncbi:MAG: ComEC/Rec2 family competence protein [Pseudomonadota bacterium]